MFGIEIGAAENERNFSPITARKLENISFPRLEKFLKKLSWLIQVCRFSSKSDISGRYVTHIIEES